VWDRHFKFYESRDILGADQGRPTNMHEMVWHQADPHKCPLSRLSGSPGAGAPRAVKVTEGNRALAGGPLD
jgi:hypothetical protein